MDDRPALNSSHCRFGLRSLMALVAIVALPLPLLAPYLEEALYYPVRYFRITVLNRRELDRISDPAARIRMTNLANEFSGAVQVGRFADARMMTTAGFQSRADPTAFQGLLEASPLRRWRPAEDFEVTFAFSDVEGRFIYTYRLNCRPKSERERPANVRLIVITEGDQLKVDQIELIQ